MSSLCLLAAMLTTFPMYKQIAITLGLVLTVGVLTTIYPQHVFAAVGCGHIGGSASSCNGVNGGTAGNSPGQS